MFYSTGGGGAIGLVYRRQDSRRATEKFAVSVRRVDRRKKAAHLNCKGTIPVIAEAPPGESSVCST